MQVVSEGCAGVFTGEVCVVMFEDENGCSVIG